MYNNLGPGQEIDLASPSPDGVDVLFSYDFVARWMRAAPARRNTDSNLYGYGDGNPLNGTDPTGLATAGNPYTCRDYSRNWYKFPAEVEKRQHMSAVFETEELFWDWFLGRARRDVTYGPGPMTHELAQSAGVQETRDIIIAAMKKNCACPAPSTGPLAAKHDYTASAGRYVVDYLFNIPTLGWFGNPVATFIGSFRMRYTVTAINCKAKTAKVHIIATNTSNLSSATRIPGTDVHIMPNNPLGPDAPFGTTTQTFTWDETISW